MRLFFFFKSLQVGEKKKPKNWTSFLCFYIFTAYHPCPALSPLIAPNRVLPRDFCKLGKRQRRSCRLWLVGAGPSQLIVLFNSRFSKFAFTVWLWNWSFAALSSKKNFLSRKTEWLVKSRILVRRKPRAHRSAEELALKIWNIFLFWRLSAHKTKDTGLNYRLHAFKNNFI